MLWYKGRGLRMPGDGFQISVARPDAHAVSDEQASVALIDRRVFTRQCLAGWLGECWRDLTITPLEDAADIDEHELADFHLILFNISPARVSSPGILERIDRLVRHPAKIPLVILSDIEDIEDVVEAIRHGVRGYIPTSLDVAEAAVAIRFVQAGGTFVPTNAVMRSPQDKQERAHANVPRVENARFDLLTPREREVAARLSQGMANKIIAHELRISEHTVKVFVHRILTKLNATNRTEVAYLTRLQLDRVAEQA
jgi:DNA-binding NarL/FixJ family response regulator